MDMIRIELLAEDIITRFKGTQLGHCARVDFLTTGEAEHICKYLSTEQTKENITVHILAKQDQVPSDSKSSYITIDKAIELRNRKEEKLCLFVPADLVDAAYSSLANSFAIIDGRTLHTRVLKRVMTQLPAKAAQFVKATFSQLRGALNVSEDQKLDFAIAVLKHSEKMTLEQVGLELWRVELIADATVGERINDPFPSDLERKLEQNRRCALALAHPLKIDATTLERIQMLKVDEATVVKLMTFFRKRSLNDVQSWSQDLAKREDGLTFDTWIFPETEISDIEEIKIRQFVNSAGIVEKYCRLIQLDGAHGSLIARCAPKEKLVVQWSTVPEQPKNLGGWRVAIVPSDSDVEHEGSLELPERDLPMQRRNITLNMNIEFEKPPDFPVRIRITALNTDGTAIVKEDEQEICAETVEFYLSKEIEKIDSKTSRESKFVVPHLAYGRLNYAIEAKDAEIYENEPQWSSKDLEYFSVKLNSRQMLQIGVSGTLLELERKIIADARDSGSYILHVEDIHPVSIDTLAQLPLPTSKSEHWNAFWKARDQFFSRLRKNAPRDVVEVADWTPELAGAAVRYAQAYRELIDSLLKDNASTQELLEAISIDSILVSIAWHEHTAEEALITLSTHPLRIAWLVSYVQLLQTWETQLLGLVIRDRKYNLDLQALRLLTPINVPPFAYHKGTSTTFAFFQNLRFFHGISLPVGIADPHRRYGDIAILFGLTVDQSVVGDTHPEQLASHLNNFYNLHSYTNTLVATLVNPDRGDFFAEAIKKFLFEHRFRDEDEKPQKVPTFQITAYTDNWHKSTLQAIEQIRKLPSDQQQYKQVTDLFLPAIHTISRPIERLNNAPNLPEAHIAVITDLTQPVIKASAAPDQNASGATSFSLYGLVSRFISQFSVNAGSLRWLHQIITEGTRKPEAHPAGAKYNELLIELHTALLNAGGYLLSGAQDMRPTLEVILTEEQRRLLERLHESTNWVVTLDRFFTLDYYDSPHEPGLNTLARKYVLDYAPEFTDGLGHRMMVTTAWHEEIQSLLSRAMNELGFAHVDQSVSHLLHHLKTISGRLALQALESSTTASAAVGLGVVTAWLEKKGRLKQAVLIPVDTYPRLFSLESSGKASSGERRCDLVLIGLKRNIVDATFIEVKWRRGHVPFEELSKEMVVQMKSSAMIMRNRFFDESRVDGALQRSYLANVLRFYLERSRRYKLFDQEVEMPFLEHISRLEKTGLEFRANYEGYIVSLQGEERRPFPVDDAKITVLTAKDFEEIAGFVSEVYAHSDTSNTFTKELVAQHDKSDDRIATAHASATFPVEQSEEPHRFPETSVSDKSSHPQLKPAGTNAAPLDSAEKIPPEKEQVQALEEQNDTVIVPLGSAANTPVDWLPAINGSPHIFILGIPGQGKSYTVTNILTELGQQQIPALVLDFHGQFANPTEPFVQAINPNVLDAAKGLPFSPFECAQDSGSGGWLANTYALAEIFGHVAQLGDMQRDVVFSAIRDAYTARGFNDETDQCTQKLTYPTLAEVLHYIEIIAQTRHVPNVTARCRPLLEMNLFRPMEDTPDLLSLVRSGLVIDLHHLFAETLQQAAGAFVLRKIYKDMFRWGYAKRIRLAIVLDEAHRLAKDVTLPKIMREGRKFGIAVIVASQSMADFHPDVLGTAGTKIIFRMNFPDSKKVSGFIRSLPGQDLPARIEQLSVGTAYVQTSEMPFGSVVKMRL